MWPSWGKNCGLDERFVLYDDIWLCLSFPMWEWPPRTVVRLMPSWIPFGLRVDAVWWDHTVMMFWCVIGPWKSKGVFIVEDWRPMNVGFHRQRKGNLMNWLRRLNTCTVFISQCLLFTLFIAKMSWHQFYTGPTFFCYWRPLCGWR